MGGAEVFTREVAKHWADYGHEVNMFTSAFPGCNREEVLDNVKIFRKGGKYSVYCHARNFYDRRFKEDHFDVVIDEINTVPFFTPKFVKHNERVFALIHQLAREYWFYDAPIPFRHVGYYFLEDFWLHNYVDVPTVTVSESTSKDLASVGFKNVSIVHEGLDFIPLRSLPTKDARPVIVFSGRLKNAKRPEHLIKAFQIIKTKIPEAELWFLGDGPLRKKLERNSSSGIRFFGNLDNFERRELIKQSWVLANPSIREGWGLNIVEANALGVPTVAYDVNGLRDSVKNGETGLLARSGDINDLAFQITSILDNSALRERLSNKALEYSAEFSWERTAKEFMSLMKLNMNER